MMLLPEHAFPLNPSARHEMGSVKALGRFFNRGPYAAVVVGHTPAIMSCGISRIYSLF